MQRKLAVAIESLHQPVRKALATAASLGAAGVQVDAVGELAPDQLSQTGRREFRNLLRSLNLELAAVGCPLRRGLDEPNQLEARLAHVQKVMTLAYDLGPRLTTVFPGRIPEEPPPPAVAEPAALASPALGRTLPGGPLLSESLRTLANHADRTGVTLALENGTETPVALRAAVEPFAGAGLGVSVNFDPATALVSGHDPAAEIAMLQGLVRLLTARDARAGRGGRSGQEVLLGHGDIDWMRIAGALEEIGYGGWIVIRRGQSPDPASEAKQALAFLKRLG